MRYKVKDDVFEGEDVLRLYLKEINNIPLLTPEEEAKLAMKVQKGDKCAQDKLVESNLRFVVKIAKEYQGRGLSLSELINEGNLGLIKAAQKFDPKRGVKFTSYAVWWIRQSIKDAISEQARIIRLPAHKVRKLSKIERAFVELSKELGYTPTTKDVAGEVGMSTGEVDEILEVSKEYLSLDQSINEDYDPLSNLIPSSQHQDISKSITKEMLRGEIEKALEILSSQEKKVIRYRYGLEGSEPLTLEKVGEILELTRERIRQIEAEAISRLREELSREILPGLDEITSFSKLIAA